MVEILTEPQREATLDDSQEADHVIGIWFEVHAQTDHNAAGLASGHDDVALTAQSVWRARLPGLPSHPYALFARTKLRLAELMQ